MDKQTVKSWLSESVCEVKFTKVDGTVRTMRCTLLAEFLPARTEGTGTSTRKVSEDVIAVWSVEDKGWRSFRVDSLVSVRALEQANG